MGTTETIYYLYGWTKFDPKRKRKPYELGSLVFEELADATRELQEDGYHGIWARTRPLKWDEYRHDRVL